MGSLTRRLASFAALSFATAAAVVVAQESGAPQRAPEIPSKVSDDERKHTVVEGPFRVSALWRSERALDAYAREALDLVLAVDLAGPRRIDDTEGGNPPMELLLAESPAGLRKLAGGRKALDEAPIVFERFRGGSAPAVAVAPRIHDRVMFGTGLPPATRRMVALVAARQLEGLSGVTDSGAFDGPDWSARLGLTQAWAQQGLETTGYSRSIAEEPWTSGGLLGVQKVLANVSAEEQPAALLQLADSSRDWSGTFDGAAPFVQSASDAAMHLLATTDGFVAAHPPKPGDSALRLEKRLEVAAAAVARLAALRPRWIVESGAVATHPYGWQAVATRKADALVLSADPLGRDSFTLSTKVTVFSNDTKVPGQGDIVLGDEDGDRVLLALNTQEGLYIFRRATRDAEYEIVSEVSVVQFPAAREVEVKIAYDGEVLNVEVGGLPMAPVRLADRRLTGRWGFGAHAGSTAMFREFTIE